MYLQSFAQYFAQVVAEWVCAQTLQKWILGFPQPSASFRCRPCWFSKPGFVRAYIPKAGLQGWGVQREVWILCSPWGPVFVIFLPFMGHCIHGVNSDWTLSLPSPPTSMWLFLFTLSCRKSFLLVFRSFLSLCVAVILVHPWRLASPRPSHSTILSLIHLIWVKDRWICVKDSNCSGTVLFYLVFTLCILIWLSNLQYFRSFSFCQTELENKW